jgi:muramidase (phage lysozyme)
MAYSFNATQGETAESIRRKREWARSLLESAVGQNPQTIGDGIAVLGRALAGRFHEWRADKAEKQLTDQAMGDFNRDFRQSQLKDLLLGNGADISGTGGADTLAGGGGRDRFAKPFKVSDPVAEDLAPHQKAFLNAISGGESGGAYNVRYTPRGPAYFNDLSQHPGIMEPGPHGKTSASGRYQFTKTTWDGLGGGDFSPVNQDHMAWRLAQRDYGARTGRNLDADLQTGGLTPQIMEVLTPTWQAFKGNRGRHASTYRDSLGRFSGNNALRGGEEDDTLGGGGVIVGDGSPSIPMADGSFSHGIRPRGPNPLPPDRMMPMGPTPQRQYPPTPQQGPMQPDPARFAGAAPKGGRLPDPNAMPQFNPMMASSPFSPAPRQMVQSMPQNMPAPQPHPQMAPAVDSMQTAAVQPQMRPRGIVSPRAEDNGYVSGPGAAMQQPGGQGGGLLARLLMRQPMPQPAAHATSQAADPVQTGSTNYQATGQEVAPDDGMTRLYALAANEFLPAGHKAAVLAEIKRREQALDPVYQMDLETRQLALEKSRRDMAKAGDPDFKVVGDDLVRIGPDGSTSIVTPQGGERPGNGEFRFAGNSIDGQALNGLIESGKLTVEQAQNIAAGKAVTGPNGEVYFFNADQLVTRPAPAGAAPGAPVPAATGGPNQLTRGKTALPPEAAARVGMGNGFLERYQTIEDDVKAGGLTGPWDQSMASIGRGRQGDLMRQIQSGQDGLLRMLTGAGMPETEAQRYISRYQPGWLDDAESATSKLQGLKYDLDHVDEAIKKGREEGLGSGTVNAPAVKLRRFNKKTGRLEEVAE